MPKSVTIHSIVGISIIALLSCCATAFGWGDETHRAIARGAAVAVPEEMRPFFLANSAFMAEHATDPDYIPDRTPAQKAEHFFDIDAYSKPPFDDVPQDQAKAIEKYGAEAMAKNGTLPWTIQREYGRLVGSMKKQDWQEVRLAAAHLSHFVADAMMPLHATKNYDGQETGNRGVHLRIEIEMMPRYHATYMVRADDLIDVTRPVDWAFKTIKQAWEQHAALHEADKAARAAAPLDSEAYYAILDRKCGDLLQRRTELAATALASFWAAAWKDAGSPVLPVDTVVIVIQPDEAAFAAGEEIGEVALAIQFEDVQASLKPTDAFSSCFMGAPLEMRGFTLPFVTAADDDLIDEASGYTGSLRDAFTVAIRALGQFPRSRRIIVLSTDELKTDPELDDAAKALKEKGITGLFLLSGEKKNFPQAEGFAQMAGAKIIWVPPDRTATRLVQENLDALLAR